MACVLCAQALPIAEARPQQNPLISSVNLENSSLTETAKTAKKLFQNFESAPLKVVKIGVLAKRGRETCLQKWGPTADYLSRWIPGYNFKIVPLDFDEIYPAAKQKKVDFILVNSSFYVGLERLYGANRIATLRNIRLGKVYTVFGGVIFCKADRKDIQRVEDLVDKTFMAVKDTSFGGWQMAWRKLKEQGIDPQLDFADLQFAGTHDAVVYAVLNGEADAGTVRTDTLEQMSQEGKIDLEDIQVIGQQKDNFTLLHSTRLYPEWPMATLPSTPDALAQKVAIALMNMPCDSPAAKAAKCAGWTIPLNYQPVHECLRELRLKPYQDTGKVTLGAVFRQYWPWLVMGLVALVAMTLIAIYVLQLNRKLTRVLLLEEKRTRQQARVAKFGQFALSGVDLDELFERAVTLISETLGTKYAKVLEHLSEKQTLFLRAGIGWKEGWVGHESVPDGPGSQGGYTLLQAEPVISESIKNETRFSPPPLLSEHNVVSGMTVAIQGVDRPFGVLGVHCEKIQNFNEDDVHFLEAIANILAATIQRTRKEEEVAKARDEAEGANRVKSEFLANMSHEIRTPMTAILGFADILLENVTNGEQLDAVAIIKRNGEHLIGILNDILDLSKIEAGKFEIEKISCSPCKILAEVVSLMRVQAEAKNLHMEVEHDGPMPESIQSGPTHLKQILINLVANAIKFTEIGKIRLVTHLVDIESKEPKMQFKLIDSGIGMSEEQIASLFKPFSQVDTSTTRKQGGTGLGLAISKRLAKKLGGDIAVESTIGKGSTFTVTIKTGSLDGVPLINCPVKFQTSATLDKARAPKKQAEETQATAKLKLDCRILLAEDGPDNQRLISYLLEKARAEVVVAENGQIAYEFATAACDEGKPFDLILMDMQMPVMDGYEATAKLRHAGYTGPIIALTAHTMSTDRDRCLIAGCNDYEMKPIDIKKLLATVAKYAKRSDNMT
jgi:signal transduction histidine kinase/ABC-type phosphate/phosphonate transport system substrate-binding protein